MLGGSLQTQTHSLRALLYIAAFFLLRLAYSPIVGLAGFYRGLNSTLVRMAFVAFLFDKILKLRLAEQRAHQAQLLNMTGGDVAVIENSFVYIPELFASSLAALIILAIVYYLIGNTALLAFGVIVLLTVLQLPIQAALRSQQKRISSATDTRLGLMHKFVEGIRTIKAAVWEQPMVAELQRARAAETSA